MPLFKVTNSQANKHFCIGCEIRTTEPEEVEFKDGFRCKDCAKVFREKSKKKEE